MAADYAQGGSPSSPFGDVLLALRTDTPADLSGGNAKLGSVQLDSAGNMRVTEEGGKATYYACSQFACDSTATDIWTLAGNATTVVKPQFLLITSVATGAASGRLQVLRRSTANTAGTVASPTVAKADSRDAAASSTPSHYTVHPSALGTSAGAIISQQYGQQASGTVPQQAAFLLDLRQFNGGKGLRLNGTGEILAVNVAAALGGAGNAWDITCCWTEEPLTA